MVKFITWCLLIGMGIFIVCTVKDIVKCLIARKKARIAGDQNKNSEKECDHSNDP